MKPTVHTGFGITAFQCILTTFRYVPIIFGYVSTAFRCWRLFFANITLFFVLYPWASVVREKAIEQFIP
ncbi:MAG: hypothetical protein LBJ00_04560 [Planctomycetaceae bacterium]|nr:hypothetical protein [Planctomycetaceae bacterium]